MGRGGHVVSQNKFDQGSWLKYFLTMTIIFVDLKLLISTIETRIAPTLLGLRQALKISIYDYLPKFHQINAELLLKFCHDAIIFIGSSSRLTQS